MAESKSAPQPTEDAPEGAPPKKKLAGKTIILFVVLPALLLLGGGGTAAVMLLSAPRGEQHASKEEKPKKEEKAAEKGAKEGEGKEGEGEEGGGAVITAGEGVYFLTLPEMLVNVTTADGRPAFLKLKLVLEARDEATVQAVEPQLPRVMDQFQAFLRELRVDDLTGSAGAYRLRLELLRRVNLAIAPQQVDAVLIEEMLIQ